MVLGWCYKSVTLVLQRNEYSAYSGGVFVTLLSGGDCDGNGVDGNGCDGDDRCPQ
jgi:hypothetical protein